MNRPLYVFKAAVHLNNSGVDLLEKGCHRQGMETLRDATAAMQMYAENELHQKIFGLEDTASPLVDTASIQDRLQQAAKRSSCPSPSAASAVSGIQVTLVADSDALYPLIRDSLLSVDITASLRRLASEKIHLVRIEPHDSQIFKKNCDTEATIILYNYGCAYRSLSILETSVPYVPVLRQGAAHYFLLAHSLITVREWNTSGIVQDRQLLMSILSLLQLASVSPEHSAYSQDHLAALVAMVRDVAPVLGHCVQQNARAA